MNSSRKIGLMLSGGAARGAFQAGVVSAFARAGLRFHAIVGTSVGAINGGAINNPFERFVVGVVRKQLL